MAVPASLPRDGFAAADALATLRSPEIEQCSTTCECLGHVPALTSLEVHFQAG